MISQQLMIGQLALQETAQEEFETYVQAQADEVAPEIEIDSQADCFGLIWRVWFGIRHIGNFYVSPMTHKWIAEVFTLQNPRFVCESPDEARDKIVQIALM